MFLQSTLSVYVWGYISCISWFVHSLFHSVFISGLLVYIPWLSVFVQCLEVYIQCLSLYMQCLSEYIQCISLYSVSSYHCTFSTFFKWFISIHQFEWVLITVYLQCLLVYVQCSLTGLHLAYICLYAVLFKRNSIALHMCRQYSRKQGLQDDSGP